MVFQNIKRIKRALPEVCHIAMFYNNGTIFQTTFEHPINIPKLGENLAEMLLHIKKLYDICEFKIDDYKRLVFETEEISLIVLKLGEDSNIGLFFRKEEGKDLKLGSIRRYLERIEDLVDVSQEEIERLDQEDEKKEEEKKEI